jgi:hypothetical protein
LCVTAATLSEWRGAFLSAGEAALVTKSANGEELAQEATTEQRHVRAILSASQHRAQGYDQHLVQRVPSVRLTRIVEISKTVIEAVHGLLTENLTLRINLSPRLLILTGARHIRFPGSERSAR